MGFRLTAGFPRGEKAALPAGKRFRARRGDGGSPVLRPAAAFSRPSLQPELLPPSKWYWESNPSAHCAGSSLYTREPCKVRLRRDFLRAASRQKTVRLRRDL